MENNPKNNQRGIGDNSVDQSFGEWASASLDDAIRYIVRLIRKNKRLEHQLNESINARNNLKRGIALSEAKKINDSISKDAKVFEPIFNAIHKGENIHTGDLKHNKLDMCDKAGNFGDWIANQTGGKEFERKIDDAIFTAKIEEDKSDED